MPSSGGRIHCFYKTLNGARVGDLFMSLIHTCELNGANPSEYLTQLLRHAGELKRSPLEWMPWNYCETLAQLATPAAERASPEAKSDSVFGRARKCCALA